MKRVVVMVSVASVVLIASVGQAAWAAPTGVAKSQKFSVRLHTTSFVVARNGMVLNPAPSTYLAGDSIFIVATLSQRGHTVGREDVYCALTEPNRDVCTSVDRLHGGTIVHTGAYPPSGTTFHDAVTGGTGRYLGARGTANAKFSSNTDAVQVYRLTG